jgi:large subunit ribosomal protein L16
MEQIEACRVAIRRCVKKKEVYIWNRLYPYCWVSKKSVGMRMGKGKGSLNKWQIPLFKGQVLYEVWFKKEEENNTFKYLKLFKAFSKAWRKLSVKTKVLFYLF